MIAPAERYPLHYCTSPPTETGPAELGGVGVKACTGLADVAFVARARYYDHFRPTVENTNSLR